MKKAFLLSLILTVTSMGAMAIATNYALRLDDKSRIQCGAMTPLESSKDYSIQLWFNADNWNPGAVLLSLNGEQALKLGAEGTVQFCGTAINSESFTAGKWNQITIISNDGEGKILVNSATVSTTALPAIADFTDVEIGGDFTGRIDELRIWNAPIAADFDYFINNTLNRWVPQVENLVAYYKFDQKICNAIVDYTEIWNPGEGYNNHGAIVGNATREKVEDNPLMTYRINGAYTSNERFFDRAIPKEQYLVSNDLIILGISSFNDGHLEYTSPCDHATVNGVKYLEEFNGRQGVGEFDGNSTLNAGASSWAPTDKNYAVEAMVYIDTWVDGAEIVSKLNEAGDKGFALVLGDEATHQLSVVLDGHVYALANKISDGQWHHIGICPNAAATTDGRWTFQFFIDGVNQSPGRSISDAEVYQVPTFDSTSKLLIGRNFKGKIDNAALWHTGQFDASSFKSHINGGLPAPGIGQTIAAYFMQRGMVAYKFDKSENIGYDSYSQDEWLAIMRSAYEGMSGYDVRISVKSHDGWENTIANPNRRKIFAADLARLSEPYDGVELDLEWIYNKQVNLGLLAEDIRAALPEDKSFNISCHNVAYQFPHENMAVVDGFTFQQYGPQPVQFQWNTFTQRCTDFVNYGFPKEKIITSYSTTTSVGVLNGTAVMERAIKGLRNGFLDDYTPRDVNSEYRTIDGYDYYFTSPRQTYRRAKYSVDNGFGGIFYWDMGNDVPFEHEYNAARWCSYALNSNVEPEVTEVEVNHPASTGNIAGPANTRMTLRYEAGELVVQGCDAKHISVCDSTGIVVLEGAPTAGRFNVSKLGKGIYVAAVRCSNGEVQPAKFAL